MLRLKGISQGHVVHRFSPMQN